MSKFNFRIKHKNDGGNIEVDVHLDKVLLASDLYNIDMSDDLKVAVKTYLIAMSTDEALQLSKALAMAVDKIYEKDISKLKEAKKNGN